MGGRSWLIGLAALSVSLCAAVGARGVERGERMQGDDGASAERDLERLARWGVRGETGIERGAGAFMPCALFEEGTDEAYVADVTRRMIELWHGQSLERFNLDDPWFGGAGVGGTLTYSFPPDGLNISSGIGEGSGPNTLHATLTQQFGSTATWKSLFRQVFDRWTAITGIEYVEVADDGATWGLAGSSNRGDIRIAAKAIDGRAGVLAYNNFPTSGDMVLDMDEPLAQGSQNFRYFRNILFHEHGHGIGLRHVCPVEGSKLMEPFISTAFDGPRHDDIRGAQFFYGDRFEPNNDTDQPTPLGAIDRGQTKFVTEVSLRDQFDVDVYSFAVPDDAIVTVSLDPFGFNYLQAEQNLNGTCPSGESFDSLARIDLGLEIILPDRQTTLRTELSGGFSEPEVVQELALGNPLPAVYYVRVSAEDFQGAAQVYSLLVRVEEPVTTCAGDLTGDGEVGSDDLALLLASWGQASPDLDENGAVGSTDLALLLALWGPCP